MRLCGGTALFISSTFFAEQRFSLACKFRERIDLSGYLLNLRIYEHLTHPLAAGKSVLKLLGRYILAV